MRAIVSARLRAAVLSVITIGALAPTVATAPVRAATANTDVTSPSDPAAVPASAATPPAVVTLVTGDRVLVRRDVHGRTSASLLPGSPHYLKPAEVLTTPQHTWVIPKLPTATQVRLDTSLFDVAALARAGRVTLQVTFAAGVAPRALPGIQLRGSTARKSVTGRTVVQASYDARRPLPTSFMHSLAGVAKVAVAGAEITATQPSPAYELHTLTVNATDEHGDPAAFAFAFVYNVDDGNLMAADGMIVDGQLKISVPDGHYFVVASTFDRVIVKQVTVDGDDLTADIALADATVQPKMTVPGDLTNLTPGLDIVGGDATNPSFFDFAWFSYPKVQPVTDVVAGHLSTQVSGLWSTKGYRPFTEHNGSQQAHPVKEVTSATAVESGIPADLTYHYHANDFAHVDVRHYATGPSQIGLGAWAATSPEIQSETYNLLPTARPGVVHANLLAGPHVVWHSLDVSDLRSFAELEQHTTYRPGQHARVSFYRGPVAPVADRGGESGRVATCELCIPCQTMCVVDGTLVGELAMEASAGTDQNGLDPNGRYVVSSGGHRLGSGRYFLGLYIRNVKPGQPMRLVATRSPLSRKYVLSSHVTDTFHFAIPQASSAVVPMLRAAYVPPTNLRSVGPAGRVSYPVTFDNLGPVDARIAQASVTWSVDGTHWHAAHLTRRDKNTFDVSYRNPVGTKAHPYLSLRVRARDVAGRSVAESVEHAYVLPHGRSRTSSLTPAVRDPRAFHPRRLCRTSAEHSYSCYVKLNRATLAAAKASPDPAGWGAPALRSAYGMGPDAADADTVAVVVAYDYPHAESDMNRYRAQFGLPACTSASGCFRKINQNGGSDTLPQADADWGVEAALDLQMISTACPTCHVVLVEADEPIDDALFQAEHTAVDAGATVINHSFGRPEMTGTETDGETFVHPGVTDVAATGDFGYEPPSFPASSPDVIAVGGTVLGRSTTNTRGWSERAWAWAGSGCSAYFAKPAGQTDTACHHRTTADLSAVARGLAIFDTSLPRRDRGWLMVDGTSASSPLVAGMIGSAGALGVRPADLYAAYASTPTVFNDVVGGSNGYCRDSYICTGAPGYDGPTGLGTPVSTQTFANLH